MTICLQLQYLIEVKYLWSIIAIRFQQATGLGAQRLILIFQSALKDRNMLVRSGLNVFLKSWDVDIYGNAKQISLIPTVSQVWFVHFHLIHLFPIVQCSRLGIEDVPNRKKVIPLKPFELKTFALQFHKCPHLSSSEIPSNQILLAYFYPLDLIEASRLAFIPGVNILPFDWIWYPGRISTSGKN